MAKSYKNIPSNNNEYPVRFRDVCFYYPNLIDYVRAILCLVANFTVFTDAHLLTASLIITAFLLDMIDGKVSRAFNQCSVIGDGIDWSCDLYVDVLLMVYKDNSFTTKPKIQPWVLLWTMIEISSALFDFAITACDRFPPPDTQTGICVILQWSQPGGKCNTLGWINWLSYPFFVTARCIYPTSSLAQCSAFLSLFQLITIGPAILSVWENVALLTSSLKRWNEKKRPVK